MTEEAALLAAVLDVPDDDAPRIVYADWLDEHSQPERAELIRVQCEAVRTKVHPNGHTDFDQHSGWVINEDRDCTRDDCRACQLRRRWRELACEHGDEWVPDGAGAFMWDWHRGFVRGVTCSAADWLVHADAIVSLHPVQTVRIASSFTADGGRIEIDQSRWPTIKTWHVPRSELFPSFFPGLFNWTLTNGDGNVIANGVDGALRRIGEAMEPIAAAFRSMGNVVANACQGFMGIDEAADEPAPEPKPLPAARRLAWGLPPRPNRKERRKAASG